MSSTPVKPARGVYVEEARVTRVSKIESEIPPTATNELRDVFTWPSSRSHGFPACDDAPGDGPEERPERIRTHSNQLAILTAPLALADDDQETRACLNFLFTFDEEERTYVRAT